MNWPFVSRGRFEDLQKRYNELDAERKRLLAEFLPKTEQVTVQPQQIATASKSDGNVVPFSTPFDKLETRLDKALRDGVARKPQFIARSR